MGAGALGRREVQGQRGGDRRGRRARPLPRRRIRPLTILVDTSALYALLDGEDQRNAAAAQAFAGLHNRAERLLTHNYVVVEVSALVRQRLGLSGQRALHTAVLPLIGVHWVDEQLHDSAVTALLAGRRRASLVDWVSFELMRRLGLETAFAFDRDFTLQGFRTIP